MIHGEKETEKFSGEVEGLKEILDELSPEAKEKLLVAANKEVFQKLTASQKYNAISKAIKDENTPEAERVILEAALKELKPLIYREQGIGTIGDRYPDSLVAFRFLGVTALLIGFFLLIQEMVWAGIVMMLLSISFLSSTKKTLS